MYLLASITHWVGNITAEQWTAAAACGTFLVAAAAGATAAFQLGEARRLRREQAQPYVVVFLEPSEADDIHVDLVVKNFGLTAATDVRVGITPPPGRSNPQLDPAVYVPASIPVLVPGQEWRTFWDSIHHRSGSELPKQHRATVSFKDAHRTEFPAFEYLLDWEPVERRGHITIYGSHHAAKALREISKTMEKWKESGTNGIRVFSRDGDALDARRAEEFARRKAAADDESLP